MESLDSEVNRKPLCSQRHATAKIMEVTERTDTQVVTAVDVIQNCQICVART